MPWITSTRCLLMPGWLSSSTGKAEGPPGPAASVWPLALGFKVSKDAWIGCPLHTCLSCTCAWWSLEAGGITNKTHAPTCSRMVDRNHKLNVKSGEAVQYYRHHGFEPRHTTEPRGQYDMLDPGPTVPVIQVGWAGWEALSSHTSGLARVFKPFRHQCGDQQVHAHCKLCALV